MSEEELKLELEGLKEEVKKVARRIDGLETDLTRLNGDRTILEDLVTSVGHLKQLVEKNQQKTTDVVEKKVDEVKDAVEKEGAVVRYSLVDELKAKFKRRNIEPRKPFWKFWRR